MPTSSSLRAERNSSVDRDLLPDTPPPFPYGWFAVAFSSELTPGKIVKRRFMDREIVLYRTASGDAAAVSAYCPHLGAHFAYGGSVEGEELRCPFHGFKFSTAGRCTSTPYGPPPPSARLRVFPLREVCGVVMAWYGPTEEVTWEIEAPDESPEWLRWRTKKMRFRSHPQEVTENSVDIGHLAVLHGFEEVRTVDKLTADGPRLRARYSFRRPFPGTRGIRTEISIRVDGLGFSLVELSLDLGWTLRQLVLTTPTGEREVDVHVGTTVRSRGRGRLGRALLWPVEALLSRAVLRGVVLELRRDQPIWDNKKYVPRPALTAGDGPIGAYRKWTRQFYPEGADK